MAKGEECWRWQQEVLPRPKSRRTRISLSSVQRILRGGDKFNEIMIIERKNVMKSVSITKIQLPDSLVSRFWSGYRVALESIENKETDDSSFVN